MTTLSPETAALLDSEPGAVALRLSRHYYAAGETPIEFRPQPLSGRPILIPDAVLQDRAGQVAAALPSRWSPRKITGGIRPATDQPVVSSKRIRVPASSSVRASSPRCASMRWIGPAIAMPKLPDGVSSGRAIAMTSRTFSPRVT